MDKFVVFDFLHDLDALAAYVAIVIDKQPRLVYRIERQLLLLGVELLDSQTQHQQLQ